VIPRLGKSIIDANINAEASDWTKCAAARP